MFRNVTKKAAAVGGAVVLSLGVAVAAFAYFTSTGTGSGSAATGTATNNITVVGTESTPLFPGGATGTVTFTASNGSVNPERLSAIHLTGVTADTVHATAGCIPAVGDWSMADVTGINQTLAGSASGTAVTPTGTLVMGDTGASQNSCEGATLTLAFTTS